MTANERDEFLKKFEAEYCASAMASKGADYSGTARGSTQDVLANFKRVGQLLDLSPTQVLMVYALKHQDSILTWLKTGNSSEPIEGRIGDFINYMRLLACLVHEEKTPMPISEWKEVEATAVGRRRNNEEASTGGNSYSPL